MFLHLRLTVKLSNFQLWQYVNIQIQSLNIHEYKNIINDLSIFFNTIKNKYLNYFITYLHFNLKNDRLYGHNQLVNNSQKQTFIAMLARIKDRILYKAFDERTLQTQLTNCVFNSGQFPYSNRPDNMLATFEYCEERTFLFLVNV